MRKGELFLITSGQESHRQREIMHIHAQLLERTRINMIFLLFSIKNLGAKSSPVKLFSWR